MPESRGRVLIIGGGLGGLTTAIALRRAGFDALVFERAPDVRKIQVGGTIIIWSNAVKALRTMDLEAQVLAVGHILERDSLYSWRGALLGVWPVADMGRRLGAPTIGIGRGQLHQTLVSALPDGMLQLGEQCTGFTQDAAGVTARFASGREERGDLLVGADGLKSTIRAQLVGDGPPKYAGYTIWQAQLRTELGTQGTSQLVFGCGRRFVLAKVDADHAHWFAVMNAPEDASYNKAALLARYRGWMEPIEAILEKTDASAISKLPVMDRTPVRRWGDGRTTLLGDAAHPIRWDLGQGGSQAIEDAMVLARCLGDSEDLVAAVRAYEQRRVTRTALLALQARQVGWTASWENRWACGFRNTAMKLAWNRGLRASTERFLIAYQA